MPKDNPYRPFTPNPDFMALWPEGYSGNAINGLGEDEVRRPTMVWWTPDMDMAEFGPLQKWFYQREEPDETMLELRRMRRKPATPPIRPLPKPGLNAVPRTGPMLCRALSRQATAK